MSQLLLSDLTALSNESKRKSPDVKAAADLALSNLRADFEGTLNKCKDASNGPSANLSHQRRGSVASQPLRTDLSEQETRVLLEENLLLKPIVLACNAKTHVKVAGLGVALLQRIVAMQVVPGNAVSPLLSLLAPLISKGDIELQLKLLQTFSALLLSYPAIHGELLSAVLNLCFRLQDSKAQVVSSTAAATIRQVVMIVFEKVVEEDRILDGIKEGGEDAAVAAPLAALSIEVPGTDGVTLFPSSADAYRVLLDLNSLAQEEPASFLKLSSLPRTFTLELIESILTNHASLVRAHPEFLFTLRRSTCPLLIRCLSEKLAFPPTLRFIRLLFVLLRQFSTELVVEVEILMSILMRFMGSDADTSAHPRWQTIVALEVTRSLCSDGKFIRDLWKWFDAKESSSPKVFTQLVLTLSSLVTQESSMVGASTAEEATSPGASVRPSIDRQSASGGGLYEAAAGMASAVFNPSGASQKDEKATLGLASAPSIQFVDQLEKAEPPTAPNTYTLLLASQSLVHLAQSLAQHVLPTYSHFVNTRAGSNSKSAPPRMDIPSLETSQAESMTRCKAMADAAHKPLRSSLFRLLSARLDDAIFCETLTAVRNWTNTCGVLGLDRARDSFISSIASIAAPREVLLASEDSKDEPRAQLTERNLAACRILAHVAVYLSGILDDRWLPVLTAISESEFLIHKAIARRSSVTREQSTASTFEDTASASPSKHAIAPSAFQPGFSLASSPLDSKTGRPQLLAGLDHASILKEVERCFENSTSLDDAAFKHFLHALCTLTELTAQQSPSSDIAGQENQTPLATPSKTAGSRHLRRDSEGAGILTHVTKGSGLLPSTVVLADLALVLRRNATRLAQLPVGEGWDRVTAQLLTVASDGDVRLTLRLQAAELLAEFLVQTTELTASSNDALGGNDAAVRCQRQIFESIRPLSIQDGKTSSAELQIRYVGAKALQEIVEKYGHALRLGWETTFEIATAACIKSGRLASSPTQAARIPQTPQKRPSLTGTSLPAAAPSKNTLPLLKVAFTSVQRICTDLLSALTLPQLRLCIDAVRGFCMSEDVNIALTAASSFWAVTAELASRSPPDGQADSETVALWMGLLAAFQVVATDSRPEVRDAAISGLFRVLTSYGSILSVAAWSQALKEIVYPLLESVTAKAQDVKREAAEAATAAANAAAAAAAVTSPQKTPKGRRTSSVTVAQTAAAQPSQPPAAAEKQWQETCVVAFQQTGSVVSDFFLSRIAPATDFSELWDELLAKIKAGYLSGPASISQSSIEALDAILRVDVANVDETLQPVVSDAWRAAWQTWSSIADGVFAAPTTFTNANLVALVEAFDALYKHQPDRIELEAVPRLQKLMTYSQSPDMLSDVDSLTKLQAVTWQAIAGLKQVPGLPSKVVGVLAERIVLPFTSSGTLPARTTFVAVHKSAVKDALEYFDAWQTEEDIYTSGALNALLASLAVPIKVRYECPPSFRYAPSDKSAASPRPLWQEASLAVSRLARGISSYIAEHGHVLSYEHYGDLWRQLLATTAAALDADAASPPSAASYESTLQDQSYDLVLLSTFETHIWPILGSERVPRDVIERFAAALARASRLNVNTTTGEDSDSIAGTVVEPAPTPRQATSFACLDLLFLLCSSGSGGKGDLSGLHRVATLTAPHLLQHVEKTLRQYVADAQLRGGAPFPRLRDEEMFMVLSHLLDVKLEEGALANDGGADASSAKESSGLAGLARRSPRALLLALHAPLCDLLALPSHTPSLAGSATGGGTHLVDPPEVTRSPPSPPSDEWAYAGRVGHHNVLDSRRLDRTEPKRLQDLARACLAAVSEAVWA